MRRTRIVLHVCLLLICCALPLIARAASTDSVVPALVKFTGVLNDITGKPLTGTVGVTFLLYKEQSGGTPLWIETQNVQADKNGHYTVQLGTSKSAGLPAELFNSGEARWLGVQVSGAAEQSRTLLLSVPYALKAADAQTLGGLPPSAFVLAAPVISNGNPTSSATSSSISAAPATTSNVTTTGGTVNALPLWTTGTNIQSSAVTQTGTGATAKIGIGTTAPATTLDIKGAETVRGALTLPATAAATATAGANSQPENLVASSFSKATGKAVNQTFQWLAEPVANNTANPSGTLNLRYGLGAAAPSETGLKLNAKGIFTFAPGQTFPGTGPGTVTSVGLSAPSSDFFSGSSVTSSGTLSFGWLVTPTSGGIPNAIVKRDGNGDFSARVIAASGISATNIVVGGASLGFANASILGRNFASGATNGFGVGGDSNSASGAGVVGGAEGGGIGVLGQAGVTGGQGVWGEAFGSQSAANGFGPDGVDGLSHDPAGSGVVAIQTSSGEALFAQSNGGLAGHFNGDVVVNGNLAKAGGSFKIDHPLDPANKYLYHSFVESPDMMNIYNGNVTTDAAGNAVVTMPEWFEALNRDFRYQLTVMGQFAQAIVASKMIDHHFTIKTDKPNVEVSWQVTGVRHDLWADAHRIPVEQLKPENERGLYLHPELFAAPVEKSIAAAHHPGVMKLLKNSKLKQAPSAKQ